MKDFSPEVVWRDLDSITPYQLNSKKHPPEQIDKIAASIAEFGVDVPIVVDGDGVIIKGHGRYAAARKLNMAQFPVIVRTDLSPVQTKQARIADNRSAFADWDLDALSMEINWLEEAGEDIDILGFDKDELDTMFVQEPEETGAEPSDTTNLDAAPPPPRNPVSRPGDVWLLNARCKHRLICGDSTEKDVISKVLAKDGMAAMMVTSPPYWAKQAYDDQPGIQGAADFCARVSDAWAGHIKRRIIINTGTTVETSIDPKGRPGVRVLLDAMWTAAMSSAGWDLRNRRVWVKSGPNPNTAPHIDSVDQSWETMLTFWRAGHTEGGQERVSEAWSIAGYFDDIKGVGRDVVGDDHPCPYPVELPRRFILLYSKQGDVVAEPFCGSGTTLLAGEVTGRSVHACELDPAYVDVSLKRWQELTGAQPILEETGETFEEVKSYRLVEDEFQEEGEPEDEETLA